MWTEDFSYRATNIFRPSAKRTRDRLAQVHVKISFLNESQIFSYSYYLLIPGIPSLLDLIIYVLTHVIPFQKLPMNLLSY